MHIRSVAGEFQFIDQRRRPLICILHTVVFGIGLLAAICFGGYAIAADKGPAYEQGRADRQAWESWFAGITGDFRAGADFWAGHRSARNPPSCSASGYSREFIEGCFVAKARLDPSDTRRKAERNYRDGWNSPLPPANAASTAPRINADGLRPASTPTPRFDFGTPRPASPKPSGNSGLLAWLTYWPVIAGIIGATAVLGWLGLNLPGARRVKIAWARVWTPVWPVLSRVAHAVRWNRGKLWTMSLIAAAVFEIIRQTLPGQNRVWSAAYTAEAVSLLVAGLLTITALPGIIGMFFKPVTWQIVGWTFRMVWPNLYQFGRIGFSAFVCYLFQFGWLDHFDPLGHFQEAILSAGQAIEAVLRTGDLWQLTLALRRPDGITDGDGIVFFIKAVYLALWRVMELICLIVMARYAAGAVIGICRGLFHLVREQLQRPPEIRAQTPHGPPPDDWETIR